MPMMRTTHLVPSNVLNIAEQWLRQVREPPPAAAGATTVVISEFMKTYSNSYTFRVAVVWDFNENSARILTTLQNQRSEQVDTLSFSHGPLARKYELADGDDGYELTIIQAAKTQITTDDIDAYVTAGGGYCPYCLSEDITDETPRRTPDAGLFTVKHECANCDAMWHDEFRLRAVPTEDRMTRRPRTNVVAE